MLPNQLKVSIVGGGITGLSTAYYLQQAAKEKQLPIEITLIEASKRLGGKIDTIHRDGFTIECGPDSFLARKKHATQLVKDLGLGEELIHNATGTAYIFQRNDLFPIPEGSVMGIPTQWQPFFRSSLVSSWGKLRAMADLFLSPQIPREDISVGSFFRQRFGDEWVEMVMEPLLSGVYGNAIDRLSLQATFPQYLSLLSQEGSLIRAMQRNRAKQQRKQLPKGMFQTLKNGLTNLIQAIEQQISTVEVIKGMGLSQIVKTGDDYQLYFVDGSQRSADIVVLTTPHHVNLSLLQSSFHSQPTQADKPTSVATVALAFAEDELDIPLEGTGFLVPRAAGFSITACTWVHKEWPHMVPKGKALLRCFIGRPEDDDIVEGTDEQILHSVLYDLQQITSIRVPEKPEFYYINRMRQSRPAYGVGHVNWVHEFKKQLAVQLPKVYVAGSFYEGVGLPDCIYQSKQIVKQVVERLEKTKSLQTI